MCGDGVVQMEAYKVDVRYHVRLLSFLIIIGTFLLTTFNCYCLGRKVEESDCYRLVPTGISFIVLLCTHLSKKAR